MPRLCFQFIGPPCDFGCLGERGLSLLTELARVADDVVIVAHVSKTAVNLANHNDRKTYYKRLLKELKLTELLHVESP